MFDHLDIENVYITYSNPSCYITTINQYIYIYLCIYKLYSLHDKQEIIMISHADLERVKNYCCIECECIISYSKRIYWIFDYYIN